MQNRIINNIVLLLCLGMFWSCNIETDGDQGTNKKKQKTLYLLRHAKSSHKEPVFNDFDRPLKKKGMRDAAMLGELLKKQNIKLDLILTSPARRTQETVEFLTKEMAYTGDIKEEKGIYRCVPSTLRKIISQLDDQYQHVMIVGHNPAILETTNALGDTTIKKMPTCALSSIAFDTDTWAEAATQKGDLVSYVYPKLLKNKKKSSTKNIKDSPKEPVATEEVTEELEVVEEFVGEE